VDRGPEPLRQPAQRFNVRGAYGGCVLWRREFTDGEAEIVLFNHGSKLPWLPADGL
jgi:hypothetical protein